MWKKYSFFFPIATREEVDIISHMARITGFGEDDVTGNNHNRLNH